MSRKTVADTALLYRSLEEQARRHPVRAIRLTGKRPEPLGLLLIDDTVPAPELASALAGLRFGELPNPATADRKEGDLPDQAWLRRQLAVEMGRVRQTRLPCALLLISVSLKTPAKAGADSLAGQAAAALASCLHQGDLLSGFQKNTLALIMPGATVGKARNRAEEMRTTLRGSDFAKNARMAVGIAVCHAYEAIPAEQLLDFAEAELARAAKMGGDAICQSSAVRAEDACQVTVEERAQLWQQPRKSQRPAEIAS